jgi:hypothetical protein
MLDLMHYNPLHNSLMVDSDSRLGEPILVLMAHSYLN